MQKMERMFAMAGGCLGQTPAGHTVSAA